MFSDDVLLEKVRHLGLNPWPVEWITAPAHVVYDVASRGLPGRFSHWSMGSIYWKLKSKHDLGVARIYELVIPTNPSIAFLLKDNTEIENLLVRAHVLAHVDFFARNRFFAILPPNSHELAAARAERINRYEARYGRDIVEQVITDAMTVAEYAQPEDYIGWRTVQEEAQHRSEWSDLEDLGKPSQDPAPLTETRVWTHTEDILAVIINECDRLEDWERDVISIVRDDALCFWPISKTKIMNEGWASYWHQQIMHELDLTDAQEMEFAKLHAGITTPHGIVLNPYHLGLVIWRSIEKEHGRETMFEVCRDDSDLSFIRNWLTEEVVLDEGLYTWKVNKEVDSKKVVATSGQDEWETVRDGIVAELAAARPAVEVINLQYELPLLYRGTKKLDKEEAEHIMVAIAHLWKAPVYLQVEEKLEDGTVKRSLFAQS